MMEEGQDVFGGHGAGGFEFAALLREEELAIGIEDGDGGDAAVEGNVIFLGDVEITVHFPDINVNDEERFVERGSDFGRVERFIEDMTIEAPITAEDDEHTSVGCGGGVKGLGDFFGGIGGGGVDILALDGLAKARGNGMSAEDNAPAIVLQAPGLRENDVFALRSCSRLKSESELLNENVDVFAGILFVDHFGGEVDKTIGLEGGPEGDFIGERDVFTVGAADFGFGSRGVEGGEGIGIAGKDSGAPLIEGRERRSEGLREGSG